MRFVAAPSCIKAVLGNPVMIRAYSDGIPANGKSVPDGAVMPKVEWAKKHKSAPPYGVTEPGRSDVAQLMVRNVDDAVVRELKKRAARCNHSAEQEHREILEHALLGPRRRSLVEVLAAIPDAGEDADFERRQMDRRA